jgi:hypothetical protein
MHNSIVNYKNINKILIYLIIITSLLWPIIQIIISQSINLNASFYSSIPIIIIFLYLLKNLKIFFLQLKINKLILLNIIYLVYIFVVTLIFNDFENALRGIKTCGVLSIYFIFILIAKDDIFKDDDKLYKLLIFLIGMISLFAYFEIFFRILDPSLFSVYNLANKANFSGISYLNYNDITGIFSGSRPLGIYFDMHTAPGLILLAAIYFYLKNNIKYSVYLLFTLIITFSTTTIITALPFIFFILKKNKYLGILFLIGLILVFGHITQKTDSLIVILSDFYNGIIFFSSSDFITIFLGEGYDLNGSSILGGGESFLVFQLAFFGIFGLIYMLYINFVNINFKLNQNYLFKIYFFSVLLLLTSHYNNLYNVSSAIIVSFIFLNLNLINEKSNFGK